MSFAPLKFNTEKAPIPDSLARRIALLADLQPTIELIQLSPTFSKFLDDPEFWKEKAEYSFHKQVRDIESMLDYVRVLTDEGLVDMGSDVYISIEEFFKRALKFGRYDLVELYLTPENADIAKIEARNVYNETLDLINDRLKETR